MPVANYENTQAREQLLERLQDERYRRTAGTFIHSFALGMLSFENVLDIVRHPDNKGCAFGCVDEHLHPIKEQDGKTVLTSHEGCGAAAAVHGMVLADAGKPENERIVSQRFIAALGDAGKKAVEAVYAGEMSSDEFGKFWSKSLAEAAGPDFAYDFVSVTRYEHQEHGHAEKIHSATGVLVDVDMSGLGHYDDGETENKPFMVTNHSKGNTEESALEDMAKEAALCALIAIAGHGILKHQDGMFTVMVAAADTYGDKLPAFIGDFTGRVNKYLAGFGVDQARVQVVPVNASR